MPLEVTLSIAVAAGVFRPYCTRLHTVGLWAGKAIAPSGSDSILPTGLQDALTDGWPSTFSLIGTSAPFIVLLAGFLYAWWAAPVAIVVMYAVSAFVNKSGLVPQTVDRYLVALLGHITRREADFRKAGDSLRAEAAVAVREQLEGLVTEYHESGVRVPDFLDVRNLPNGDRRSLKRGLGAAAA